MTQTTSEDIHFVFDGFPGPEGPRFIESEDPRGRSISAGEWRERADGYCELVVPRGDEFLEFKEALDDLRSLRQEHHDLNGGGPGWAERNKAAWAKVDELFADEDEAAWERAQEGTFG